VLRRPWM